MKLAAQGIGGCRGRIEESPNIFFVWRLMSRQSASLRHKAFPPALYQKISLNEIS